MSSKSIINHKESIWVSQDYLRSNTDVDYGYLRVAKCRAKDKKATWRNTMIDNVSYFDINCLPKKYRVQIPDTETLRTYSEKPKNDIEDIMDIALQNRFKVFLKHYSSHSYRKNKALATAAAIIDEANTYVEVNDISFSKSSFFKSLAEEIKLQEIQYLPVTWRNIRDKIQDYANGGTITDIINVKNIGNTNRAEFKDNAFITDNLIALAGSEKNYSSAYIYRKLRFICQQNDIDRYPSERWVSTTIAQPDIQYLISQRYGKNTRFNAHYRAYTPGKSALFAGDAWEIDGTRVNIIDHRATVTVKGKRVTKQKFLYIVAVRDVMSGNPLGWEYCYEESAQAIIGALAMAVRNAGYLPYEFVYDRFPGHNTDEWKWIEQQMTNKGVQMTVTHKAEGKAHIERWFGTLQSIFMMDHDLYYGEGIRSTHKHAHRSKEYIADMRKWAAKNHFNFDDACHETDEILHRYMHTKLSDYSRKYKHIDQTPAQLHEQSDKPNVIKISHPQYCNMFGLRKEVSIRNYMIQTQINNATYYYGIDDVNVVEKYTGVKLWNCFDYEDLSEVHLFNDNTYLGTFSEITPAQRYGPDKDMRAVGITKKLHQDNEAYREEKLHKMLSEETYNEAPGDVSAEVGILQGGNIAKRLYEQAETAFLREQWDDEDEDVIINTKKRNY